MKGNTMAIPQPRAPRYMQYVKTIVITVTEANDDPRDFTIDDIKNSLQGWNCSPECEGRIFNVINIMVLE